MSLTEVQVEGKARRLASEAREWRLAAERLEREQKREREAERNRRHLDRHPTAAPSAEGLAAWEQAQGRMQDLLEGGSWAIWGEPVHPHRLVDGVWWLACPARLRGWVQERFGRAWEWALDAPVRFVICDQSTSERGMT